MNIKSIPREYLYVAIRVLSLSALVFASMLAVDYYMSANTFCDAGASCEVVAKSEFGQKYGIFLPTLGLVAYSFFFLTSFFFAKTKWKIFGKSVRSFWVPLAIICCAIGALLFIIVQAHEIKAFCWLCMGIDTSAILAVIPAILLMLGNKSEQENKPTFLHPIIWIALYFGIVSCPLAWGSFHPPVVDTSVAANDVDFQKAIQEKVPEYIRSKYDVNKVNVYEISSFDCPHCRKLHPELSKLLNEYGDKINFMRTTIPLGKNTEAVVAYYCAEQQKKELAFADCMFETPTKDPQQILNHARECSINEENFVKCLQSPETQKAVDQSLADIRATGFKGAPTVWIDSQSIIGFNEKAGMDPYRQAIELNPIIRQAKDQTNIEEPSIFETKPVLFDICLTLAVLTFITGIGVQVKGSKKTSASSEVIADASKESDEIDKATENDKTDDKASETEENTLNS